MKVIGLAGPAGVGKSTAARLLEQALVANGEQDVRLFAFADPVREAAAAIFGLPLSVMFDEAMKHQPVLADGRTIRELLQFVGTELCRGIIGSNVWIDAAERRIRASGCKVAIFQDVRFSNEAQWIRQLGGQLIHLTGPCRRQMTRQMGRHVAEAGISRYPSDLLVSNEGTEAELAGALSRLLDSVVLGGEEHAA